MGLFDFLKKKKEEYNSSIILEDLLKRAATDPDARPEFYKKLLTGKLVVITENSCLKDGIQTLKQGTSVNIVAFPDGKIPVFTSKERIFDKGIVKEQVEVLEVRSEDIFNFFKGATLVLNPYSDYGKELLPNEIEGLLSGTIFYTMDQTIKIEKATEVQIGQPAVYPFEIVNLLIPLLTNESAVKAAYVAWVYYPDSEEPAHYLFGIDADGDVKDINKKAGTEVKKLLKTGQFVDFTKKDAFDYFDTIEPFYKKV